ncbi:MULTISPECIES: hypothetical protein [Bradyrhizobium]|uniref:hypothetical protein n=1 Tax=Bradyrhizobium TaxID=374 RepID=UPI00040266FB|nr:hypothetical protein CWO90_46520 [Bradyrhizobium sp. Leo121]TAI59840.1 hypothetical protein CWO89_44020 [Bradyrhizobium sp. Leo170]
MPFAKERLVVDNEVLGFLLLCLGISSVISMLLIRLLSARYGSKSIIRIGWFGIALILPWLAVAGTPVALGAVLAAFGAFLKFIDVAANVDAVELERAAKRPPMSGFHAQFTIRECAGSGAITALAGCSSGLFHQP